METGDPGGRIGVQHAGREHDEEIGPERIPFDAAQAGHLGFQVLAGDLEAQGIVQGDAQVFRQPDLDRSDALTAIFRIPPAAGQNAVILLQAVGPGQVKLPLHQALGARVVITIRPHRPAVDRRQPSAHHREQFSAA